MGLLDVHDEWPAAEAVPATLVPLLRGPFRLDAVVEAEAAVLEAEDARLIASDTNQGLGSPGRDGSCQGGVISFGLVGVELGEAGEGLLEGVGFT